MNKFGRLPLLSRLRGRPSSTLTSTLKFTKRQGEDARRRSRPKAGKEARARPLLDTARPPGPPRPRPTTKPRDPPHDDAGGGRSRRTAMPVAEATTPTRVKGRKRPAEAVVTQPEDTMRKRLRRVRACVPVRVRVRAWQCARIRRARGCVCARARVCAALTVTPRSMDRGPGSITRF